MCCFAPKRDLTWGRFARLPLSVSPSGDAERSYLEDNPDPSRLKKSTMIDALNNQYRLLHSVQGGNAGNYSSFIRRGAVAPHINLGSSTVSLDRGMLSTLRK